MMSVGVLNVHEGSPGDKRWVLVWVCLAPMKVHPVIELEYRCHCECVQCPAPMQVHLVTEL